METDYFALSFALLFMVGIGACVIVALIRNVFTASKHGVFSCRMCKSDVYYPVNKRPEVSLCTSCENTVKAVHARMATSDFASPQSMNAGKSQ